MWVHLSHGHWLSKTNTIRGCNLYIFSAGYRFLTPISALVLVWSYLSEHRCESTEDWWKHKSNTTQPDRSHNENIITFTARDLNALSSSETSSWKESIRSIKFTTVSWCFFELLITKSQPTVSWIQVVIVYLFALVIMQAVHVGGKPARSGHLSSFGSGGAGEKRHRPAAGGDSQNCEPLLHPGERGRWVTSHHNGLSYYDFIYLYIVLLRNDYYVIRLGCSERLEGCVVWRREAEDGHGQDVLSQVWSIVFTFLTLDLLIVKQFQVWSFSLYDII